MDWSAEKYVAFEDERSRPVRDLLNAVPFKEVRAAIDLGCGPGNSTAVLAARFPLADIEGLDSSPDMIDAARERLPGCRFEVGTVQRWTASVPYDLILSNAALHWVPDHRTLFPSLVDRLAPGGSLAVQMPDNLDEPAHRLMRKVATSGPWTARLAGTATARTALESAGGYYDLLRRCCARVDIWRTTYRHPLGGGVDAVVSWFAGSGLRPFLHALDEDHKTLFLERYRSAVSQAYPSLPDGSVLLPFPRLFIVATR